MYFSKVSYFVPGTSPHEPIRSTNEFRRTFLVTKVASDAGDKIAGTGAWPT